MNSPTPTTIQPASGARDGGRSPNQEHSPDFCGELAAQSPHYIKRRSRIQPTTVIATLAALAYQMGEMVIQAPPRLSRPLSDLSAASVPGPPPPPRLRRPSPTSPPLRSLVRPAAASPPQSDLSAASVPGPPRRGFAARCEAGLCPAVSPPKDLGLCPWFGLRPSAFA